MKINNSKSIKEKLVNRFKESKRKFFILLKKNPGVIPLISLFIAFLVFSLNLTAISNTTAKIQGNDMGLCEFIAMLFSMLSMICLLNAFPKRKKANIPMILLYIAMYVIIVLADINYLNCISASDIKITKATMFIPQANNVIVAHIICMSITTLLVLLKPVYSKLFKKLNTSVELEETKISNIELSDEE